MEESGEKEVGVDVDDNGSDFSDDMSVTDIIENIENSCKGYIDLIDRGMETIKSIRTQIEEISGGELVLIPINSEVAADYDFFRDGKPVPLIVAIEEILMLALKDLDDSKGEEYTFGERLEALFEHTTFG